MLKRCSLAILSIVVMAHNAYAVIDCVRLMENMAQYVEQFKEGVHTMEDMYRRAEEVGVLKFLDDVKDIADNTQSAIDKAMKAGKAIQPGKAGGSFTGKEDSLPALPTQPYKPEGKDTVVKAAKQGFAGKETITKWVNKQLFSNERTKDSDQPTEQEVWEEKRKLLNNMRNAAAVTNYAYAVMVQLRLENMSSDEEKSALETISKAKTEAEKLKALESLQKRITTRVNEVNKIKAKISELAALEAMQLDDVELEEDEGQKGDKK
ncbi:MAG: hypothetical protein ILP11_02505 [Alphaproteobacteria bacterium]|nr:hypothetical protein [Alphaproteobacteria bacterium]